MKVDRWWSLTNVARWWKKQTNREWALEHWLSGRRTKSEMIALDQWSVGWLKNREMTSSPIQGQTESFLHPCRTCPAFTDLHTMLTCKGKTIQRNENKTRKEFLLSLCWQGRHCACLLQSEVMTCSHSASHSEIHPVADILTIPSCNLAVSGKRKLPSKHHRSFCFGVLDVSQYAVRRVQGTVKKFSERLDTNLRYRFGVFRLVCHCFALKIQLCTKMERNFDRIAGLQFQGAECFIFGPSHSLQLRLFGVGRNWRRKDERVSEPQVDNKRGQCLKCTETPKVLWFYQCCFLCFSIIQVLSFFGMKRKGWKLPADKTGEALGELTNSTSFCMVLITTMMKVQLGNYISSIKYSQFITRQQGERFLWKQCSSH